MRLITNINNQKCLEWGINATHGALFDLLNLSAAWAKEIVVDGEVYYWVSRTVVIEQLPLYFSKKDTVYRCLKNLAEKGLIEYRKDGDKDCIKLTEKGKTWNVRFDQDDLGKISDTSEKNPNNLGKISENARKNFRHNRGKDNRSKTVGSTPYSPPASENQNSEQKSKKQTSPSDEKKFDAKAELLKLEVSNQVVDDFLEFRKMKKAIVKKTVINRLSNQADKAGLKLEEVLEIMITNNWQGFDASWLKNKAFEKPRQQSNISTDFGEGYIHPKMVFNND